MVNRKSVAASRSDTEDGSRHTQPSEKRQGLEQRNKRKPRSFARTERKRYERRVDLMWRGMVRPSEDAREPLSIDYRPRIELYSTQRGYRIRRIAPVTNDSDAHDCDKLGFVSLDARSGTQDVSIYRPCIGPLATPMYCEADDRLVNGSYGQGLVSDVSTLQRHASQSTLYTHSIAADAG